MYTLILENKLTISSVNQSRSYHQAWQQWKIKFHLPSGWKTSSHMAKSVSGVGKCDTPKEEK